jgi:hypothetical protein
MSFIKPLLDTSVGVGITNKMIPQPVQRVFMKLKQQWIEHAKTINGNIEFGSPVGGPININGKWVTSTTPVTPNTDFVVTHNLGRIPVDHTPRTKNAAVDIYLSPTPNATPTTTIILRATVGSVNVTFFFV